MIKKYGMLVVAVSLATARLAFGDVRLPAIISDHMVLLKAERSGAGRTRAKRSGLC